MSAIDTLVAALRDPASVTVLDHDQWSGLISVARCEVLLGTLACRLDGQALPADVASLFTAQRAAAAQAQVHALWEAQMCRVALAPIGVVPVLLKGTAYAAAGLPPAPGRQIGDLDILVPRDRLDDVEAALLGAGWEWVKDDPYDQAYYRTHMHELPPLIHSVRDRMIDVHHTILPLTARPHPDAAAMLVDSIPLPTKPFVSSEVETGCTVEGPLDYARGERHIGFSILSPADMVCHAAAHLFSDGDLAGGLRNLWDIDRLLRHFADVDAGFWHALSLRAQHHGLWRAVHRAARLAQDVYGCPIPADWAMRAISRDWGDALFVARMTARDDWGRETRPLLRLIFTIRSHWMRMPPMMLARHLWTKWSKRRARP